MSQKRYSNYRSTVIGLIVICLVPAPACTPAADEAQSTSRPAETEKIRYGKARKLADLADERISESSGVAAGRLADGVFWTHNDSGDAPRIYAFNLKGEALATYTVTGAQAVDWEDMASFTLDEKPYLLLADIGDNAARRKFVTLYVVPEPKLSDDARGAAGRVAVAMKIDFTYADGPQDCEAVAVDPTERAIILVSKRGRRKAYKLPLPDETPAKPLVAEKIADLDIPWTTAMDISPDGRRAVVLTYADAYEYVREKGQTWAQAFARPPVKLPMPGRAQGEGICYGRDGKTLYLTSEKLPAPLLEVPVVEGD